MSGSITGEDMRTDEGAYENNDVESKIAQHLAELGGGPSTPEPEIDDEPEIEDDDSTPDEKPAEDDDLPEQDDNDDEEPAEEEKPAIPERLLRAAHYNGWTPEEISEFYEASPTQALKTLEKMHKSMNDLSRQFAQAGRVRVQQQQRRQPEVQPETKDFIDLKALREADPENDLLPIVEGLNEALKELRGGSKKPADPEPANQQMDLSLAQQILTFLGSDRMKTFEDFYGSAFTEEGMPDFEGRNMTPGQAANRRALIDEADALWLGSEMHGRELSVAEALEKAHMLLTENVREERVRKELVGKVKKRGKGVTLRPTKNRPPASNNAKSKPKNQEELEARTEQRLAEARKKFGIR